MFNEHYSSAIIGLEAQFVNQNSAQTNVDRVERALYLGKSQGGVQGYARTDARTDAQDEATTLTAFSSETCQQALNRMAQANKLQCSDITTLIVSQHSSNDSHSDNNNNAQTIAIENSLVFSSLAKALNQLTQLIEQDKIVALIGFGLGNVFASDCKSNCETNGADGESQATISFDQSFKGYQGCNGVAALLFSSVDFAKSNNHYVYAWLKGFANGNDVAAVTSAALNHAQVNSAEIGLLEVSALADPKKSVTESSHLIASYANDNKLTTAISCARSVTGEGKGFSQIVGLLRTVIALQQRYIPAITHWQQPRSSELDQWQNSNFYLPTESRPWYPHKDGSAHIAAYSCLTTNDYCHLILAENKLHCDDEKHPANDIRHNGFIACSDLQMVLVTANSQEDLLSKLFTLEETLEQSFEDDSALIKTIALNYFINSKSTINTYTISLLCESKIELLKEIQSAKSGVALAFANLKEWRTPKGSFFTPLPVNSQSENQTNKDDDNNNNVSFLYPGIGATYIGLGRDLFHLFPKIHQNVANLADDIGATLKDTLLNPRTIIRPDFNTLKQLDLDLRGNLADIAEAGVGFACVFTKVFENVFNVNADYATGYSMGEVSMYAALGAWQQPGLMSARLANSDTFNHRLCGDLLTLREHWGIDIETNTKTNTKTNADQNKIWETYTIKATLDEVIVASEGEERVYCTIINTPDSLLLAGYPEDCLRVIKKLGVRAMALNMANAIHSAPAKKEYDDMVELYTMDVTPRLKTKMYSSSCYLPVPQLSKAIAHSVAKCLCERVDFPRLINTMHSKGARVFIEMGAGRSLCSWVDKILSFEDEAETGEKPRVAVPVNAKGTSDELTYLRALAKLISHGVKLDIDTLFYGSIIVEK
ncbi:MAG: PfaB family protein [Pseudoalteromonas sp.]|nr:PfaB family protein [Pseudoalteromonas sp.]